MKKRKFWYLLFLSLWVVGLAGCSEGTVDSAGKVYDSLVDLGKDIYKDVDGAIGEYSDTSTNSAGGSALEPSTESYESILKNYSKDVLVSGDTVLSLVSGIKATDSTMIIQMGGEDAIVLGKLVTADGTEYVKGLNELMNVDGQYTYDFCGMNGIIPKAIPNMANKNYKIFRYDAYSTDVMQFDYLDDTYKFYKLNLYEGDTLVGFYFSEVEVD